MSEYYFRCAKSKVNCKDCEEKGGCVIYRALTYAQQHLEKFWTAQLQKKVKALVKS